jgi:Kef-type K+ transport system membrane component KefB
MTTSRRTERPVRSIVVYGALVVVPAALAIVVLKADIGGGAGRPHPAATAATVHPLAQLFLATAVVVGGCKLAGLLARRAGQPAVVGEIAAGIVLGPSVLGALAPSVRHWVLPPRVLPQLDVLAQVGVVLFVFLVGLEFKRRAITGNGRLALVVSHVSIAVPFLFGVALAAIAYRRFAPPGIGHLPFALFLGLSMSVTAMPVLARILLDLGMSGGRIGTLAMTCALVDDVTAWLMLAVVVALAGASSTSGVLVTLSLTVAFVVLMIVLRPLLARLVAVANTRARVTATAQLILVGAILAAAATEWIGVQSIFGAFLFGMAVPADNPVARQLTGTVSRLTGLLLLPLFFADNGLRTNLTLLAGHGTLWLWSGLILVIAVAGKFGGSALAARACGTGWRAATQIGALMNTRGLTELVVLNIGRQLGVLGPALFAILVLMALVSTAMAAPIIRLARRGSPDVDVDAVEPPADDDAATHEPPQRAARDSSTSSAPASSPGHPPTGRSR